MRDKLAQLFCPQKSACKIESTIIKGCYEEMMMKILKLFNVKEMEKWLKKSEGSWEKKIGQINLLVWINKIKNLN